MKRVLVTGASGFIGRRCLPLLAARGFEVHAAGSRDCDLRDPAAAAALVQRLQPSHLLHLAWIAQPGVFWTSPDNARWLAAGKALVEAFYRHGGRRAVGVGSCAEYADSGQACVEDATPIAPATPYAEAKVAMSLALRAAARGHGSWAWARLFLPYGLDEPPNRFIPAVIDGLLRREPVACTEGRQVRDFIFVEDAAAACAALVDSDAAGAYNVGSGEGRSLRDAAQLIVAELGHGELLRFGERKAPPQDPPHVVADIGKLRNALGWAPRVSLAEGIRRSIAARRRTVNGLNGVT
jgi:nucleoside-diphosphate-sugar epimerase